MQPEDLVHFAIRYFQALQTTPPSCSRVEDDSREVEPEPVAEQHMLTSSEPALTPSNEESSFDAEDA